MSNSLILLFFFHSYFRFSLTLISFLQRFRLSYFMSNVLYPPCFIHQLAVFIYYAVWKPQKQWVTLDEGIWNSPLTYKPECRNEAWRFISYMFVHAG